MIEGASPILDQGSGVGSPAPLAEEEEEGTGEEEEEGDDVPADEANYSPERG